jgi:hypothetical protein
VIRSIVLFLLVLFLLLAFVGLFGWVGRWELMILAGVAAAITIVEARWRRRPNEA